MNISGVLVRTKPENIDAVWKGLEQLAGVEVHGANPDGRLVVTVEEVSDQSMADAVVRLQDVPSVIAASMIYHEFEKNDFEKGADAGRETVASASMADTADMAGTNAAQNPLSLDAQSAASLEAQS